MHFPAPRVCRVSRVCRLAAVVAWATIALLPVRAGAAASSDEALPRKEREALEKTLRQVFDALPAPAVAFRRDVEGDDREITSPVPPRAAEGTWLVPAGARGTRVYTARGPNDEEFGLEISVYLNQESALSDPLGSAGGTVRMDVIDDALVSRHSLAGIDASRVKLPFTDRDRATALTVIRIYVAPAAARDYLETLAQGRRVEGNPWGGVRAKRPSEVRTIVVEYHGPAGEVDRLAAATEVPRLRKMLSR